MKDQNLLLFLFNRDITIIVTSTIINVIIIVVAFVVVITITITSTTSVTTVSSTLTNLTTIIRNLKFSYHLIPFLFDSEFGPPRTIVCCF